MGLEIKKRIHKKKPVAGSIEEVPTHRGHDGQVYRNVDNARSM